jgi:hypothetical protein
MKNNGWNTIAEPSNSHFKQSQGGGRRGGSGQNGNPMQKAQERL